MTYHFATTMQKCTRRSSAESVHNLVGFLYFRSNESYKGEKADSVICEQVAICIQVMMNILISH
jgi:hypothetical protein